MSLLASGFGGSGSLAFVLIFAVIAMQIMRRRNRMGGGRGGPFGGGGFGGGGFGGGGFGGGRGL